MKIWEAPNGKLVTISIMLLLWAVTSCSSRTSEAEYQTVQASQCIVFEVAAALQEHVDKVGNLPENISDIYRIVDVGAPIKCGPQLMIWSNGALVDSQGVPLEFHISDDSVVVFSKNVPSTVDMGDGAYFGQRISISGRSETRVSRNLKN